MVNLRMLFQPICRGALAGAFVVALDLSPFFFERSPDARPFAHAWFGQVMMFVECYLFALVPSVFVATVVWIIARSEIARHHPGRPDIWQRRVLLWATGLGAVPLVLLLLLTKFDGMSFWSRMGDIAVIGLGPMIGSFVGAIVFNQAVNKQLDKYNSHV